MTAERESMTLQEMDAPALGVEERRDEAPGAGASHARPTPDPEVMAKPKRRKFTAQYRLRILEEAESCTQPGEVGRLLRREGLYSSHLKQLAIRRISPRPRSSRPDSNPPASDVMIPPSNPATTMCRSTGSNSNNVGLHSVCIGAFPELR